MAVRSVGGEKPGLKLTMGIELTAQGVVVKNDIVKIGTSNNWCVNTTAAHDDLLDCGIVRWVQADSKLCTVEFFHWHDCIELVNSTGTPVVGSQVYMGNAAKADKVATSGIAGVNNLVVAVGSTTCHVLFR